MGYVPADAALLSAVISTVNRTPVAFIPLYRVDHSFVSEEGFRTDQATSECVKALMEAGIRHGAAC
jgi:hypothetical protein